MDSSIDLSILDVEPAHEYHAKARRRTFALPRAATPTRLPSPSAARVLDVV